MPPKRRKAADNAPDQEAPKKRTTRSETRAKESKKVETATKRTETDEKLASKTSTKSKPQSANATTPASKPSTQKASIKATKPPSSTKKSPTTKPAKDPEDPTLSNIQDLTISSPLVKSPIQCNFYAPPSSTSYTTSSSPARGSNTLIFTHGAGGTLSAPAVVHFCTGYSASYPVLAFQGSMNLAVRTAGFHACVEHIDEGGDEDEEKARSVVLGGRSMGARAAVIAGTELLSNSTTTTKLPTAATPRVRLILISYPLLSPKGAIRDAILLALPAEVEVLFISGDADTMCPLTLLDEVREKMKARSRLVVVRGADHGMGVKPKKRTREVGEETGRLAARWVRGELEGDGEVVYIGEEDEEVEGE